MLKFSTIIPVYNAEKTIERCLQSVLNNAYKELEVLLVDDGSTDRSAQMIRTFAEIDSRVKLICQENAGPSAARNRGIEQCEGDVITFIDSDDYISENYYETLAAEFESGNADVVYFEFDRVDALKGESLSVQHLPALEHSYRDSLKTLSRQDMFGYTWIKAFRRELIGDHRYREDMNLFEDEVFTCDVLEKPCVISFCHNVLYHYVRAENTLATRVHDDYYRNCEIVYLSWKKLLEASKTEEDLLREKANHMTTVCKFYALEKQVPFLPFCKGTIQCSFFKESTVTDWFCTTLREKHWLTLLVYSKRYKIRAFLGKYL